MAVAGVEPVLRGVAEGLLPGHMVVPRLLVVLGVLDTPIRCAGAAVAVRQAQI